MTLPNPFVLPVQDIVRYFETRYPRAIGAWDELGAAEYSRAFAVARTAGYDLITDLYDGLLETVRSGGTEVDYAKLVTPILEQKGWLAGATRGQIASRVQLVWEQNLRMARAAGEWDRVQRTAQTFPYIRGFTAADERVRRPPKSPHSDHRAWQGIILPVDHPFWTRWWIPLGFRCRCQIMQLTRSQVLRYGGVTSEEELARREAELGTPVFSTPAVTLSLQLVEMVQPTNDRRLEGLPPVNAQQEISKGQNTWAAARERLSGEQADRLIEQLFGKAA